MNTPGNAQEMRRSFPGMSPPAARDAASVWLRDFSAHGPLDIRSIRVTEAGGAFIATVVYSEASIEITPRHYPEREPQPLLKSA
jgi:hypothetical protein